MNLSSASVDLSNAHESVRLAWEDACAVWDDPVRRDFEKNRWILLDNHVRNVLQAMDRLAPILARAVRECS